jgi:hypothetical protein
MLLCFGAGWYPGKNWEEDLDPLFSLPDMPPQLFPGPVRGTQSGSRELEDDQDQVV